MTNPRSMVFLAILVLAVVASTVAARAQDTTTTTPPDSTRTGNPLADLARQSGQAYAAPDTVVRSQIGVRFTPKYLNKINGDVNEVSMKNAFDVKMTTSFGSLFSAFISAEEKHYRLQNKRDENKQLVVSLLHTFDVFTNGAISFLDTRSFNRSFIPGGTLQDYVFNDKSVNASGSYKRTFDTDAPVLKSFRLDGLASGAAVLGERTYKNDKTLAAGAFGGVLADFRARHIIVQGRGGHRETWDRSETAFREFDDLGSNEDSLSTGLLAELGDSIFVDARYVYYESQRLWADQAQGSLGGQQGGEENVFQEDERRSSRATVISLNAKVMDRFNVIVTGSHDSQLYDYAVQRTRITNTVADALKGTVSYVAPWKTVAAVTLENSKTLRDLGPLSVGSYDDIRKKAGIALSHRFTPTFSINLGANTQLTRSEYVDYAANPRDRDQVDTSVSLKVVSTPFPRLTAGVSLAYSASQYIQIDSTQSGDNRDRELYELRPDFTYVFNKYLTVTQLYGIQIEYIDYIYKSTQNYLDRSLTFGNTFVCNPMTRVDFVFDYKYTFHDKGSYLPDELTGEEELSVQSEDRRDRIALGLKYRVMDRVRSYGGQNLNQSVELFADQVYGRLEDRSLFTDAVDVVTDGLLRVGSRGEFDRGNGRTFRFSLARVKKSSRFGSEKEKNYWEMQSEFNYSF